MTCSAAAGGGGAAHVCACARTAHAHTKKHPPAPPSPHTSTLRPTSPPLNSCHCCVNGGERFGIMHRPASSRRSGGGRSPRDYCKKGEGGKKICHITFTARVVSHNDLNRQNTARVCEPLTLNSAADPGRLNYTFGALFFFF